MTKTFFANGIEWKHNGTEVVSGRWDNNDLYKKLSLLNVPSSQLESFSKLLQLILKGGVAVCATDQVILFLEYLT